MALPPLTKGGRGDFARDCTRQCTNVMWFDLGPSVPDGYACIDADDIYFLKVIPALQDLYGLGFKSCYRL